MYKNIIFVCTENTAQSPMAETIYQSMDNFIPSFSRGVVVLFSEPINEKAEAVLENHGLTSSVKVSREIKNEDITDDTLVLTMSDKQKKQIEEKFTIKNLYTIKEFNGETGDVKDPYGGNLLDYEDCYNELLRLIKKTIYKLDESERGSRRISELEC